MSRYALERQVALSAVLKASLVARKVQDQLVGSGGVEKRDKSPVTGESLRCRSCGKRLGWNWEGRGAGVVGRQGGGGGRWSKRGWGCMGWSSGRLWRGEARISSSTSLGERGLSTGSRVVGYLVHDDQSDM